MSSLPKAQVKRWLLESFEGSSADASGRWREGQREERKEEGPSAFVGGEDCCCKAREAERPHPQQQAGCKLVELTTWTGWWKLEVHSFWIKPRAGWGRLEVHPYRPKGGPHCRELPRAHKTQLTFGSFPPSSADLSQVIF